MSSIPLSSAGLDPRRRRILFRAWRRGLREMDLALGQLVQLQSATNEELSAGLAALQKRQVYILNGLMALLPLAELVKLGLSVKSVGLLT